MAGILPWGSLSFRRNSSPKASLSSTEPVEVRRRSRPSNRDESEFEFRKSKYIYRNQSLFSRTSISKMRSEDGGDPRTKMRKLTNVTVKGEGNDGKSDTE